MLRACDKLTTWLGSLALGDEITVKFVLPPNAALICGKGLTTLTSALDALVPRALPPVVMPMNSGLPVRVPLGG